MDAVEIIPPDGPINATVRPPGSKSITNRALPIAAVAKGTSTLTGVLKSDDTIYMIKALKQLGVEIDDSRLSDIPEESVVVVHGCDGRFPATEADLFLGNSGTSIRFLTAMVAAAGRGTYRLDGIERMRQRPIRDLVDALTQLGAKIRYEEQEGFPPIAIEASGLNGGSVELPGGISSQFTSALLMAARLAKAQVRFTVLGRQVSSSYVRMTLFVMAQSTYSYLPIEELNSLSNTDTANLVVDPLQYPGQSLAVESDASGGSYWFAAAALCGRLTVEGVKSDFLQSDFRFAYVMKEIGAQLWIDARDFCQDMAMLVGNEVSGGTFDFGDISDTAQTMAAVAVFADSPTTVTGVEHMRHKECDRVSAVVTELRKLGIECDEHTDGYTIYPGTPVCKEPIETYDDHRMAMSFALLGLKVPGIIIKDPDCVNKTYPRFWDDWAKVTGKPVRRFTL